MQEVGSRKKEVAGVPVRGTQSFVHVMGAVWRRPSLTGLEVAWRWVAGVIVMWVGWAVVEPPFILSGVHWNGLAGSSVFRPVETVQNLDAFAQTMWSGVFPSLKVVVPAVVVVWLIVAAIGRTVVLQRMDGALKARRVTLLVLGSVRAGLVVVVWGLLFGVIRWAVRVTILGPAVAHAEPNLVLFFAIVIVSAILLYVVWGIFSWPFYLAPLVAMERGLGPVNALRVALRGGAVRGKLIEINLVMNIVKIAVLVLAMVLSASPLPFSSVETAGFLACWWGGVILVYLVALDYFHVVRAAAYLSLWRAYNISDSGVAAGR